MIKKELIIEKSWCKACGICAEFCPKKVLEVKEKVEIVNLENCIFCRQCELRCPDYAIYVKEGKNE